MANRIGLSIHHQMLSKYPNYAYLQRDILRASEESSIFANKKNMQRIKSAIKDCIVASIILVIYHPFRLVGDEKSIIMTIIGIIIIGFVVSLVTSFISQKLTGWKKPACYETDMKRMLWQYIFNTLLLSVVLIFYIGWQMRGDWLAMWDFGEYYSLWPLASMIPGVALVYFPLFVWNRIQLKNRYLKVEVEELQTLNALLETEQKMLRSRLTKDDVTDKIILHGDSRESLIVNPLDIMYVESVGNYLNVVYFNDADLCQKRLRSSLKEMEETLEAFPFMVHTHRAFLVNINFITQVSGNSGGYKINMFSTDRVLPVSKANVATFRSKILEIGSVHSTNYTV